MENLKPSEILNVRDQANDTERKENMRHTKQKLLQTKAHRLSRFQELGRFLNVWLMEEEKNWDQEG